MDEAAAGKRSRRSTDEGPDDEAAAADIPTKIRSSSARREANEAAEGLDFEDPYGDEYDEEERVYDEDDEEAAAIDEVSEPMVDDMPRRPWRLGVDPIAAGEELEFDPATYDMYHRAMLDWSCLSFDILPDHLGQCRSEYPHTMYVVAGTQAEKADDNRLFMMKWRNLTMTRKQRTDSDDSGDSDASDDVEASTPILDFRFLEHPGTVNRVRACPQIPRLIGTWSDDGKVYMWDVKDHYDRLDTPGPFPNKKPEPKFVFSGHRTEGYALSFNPVHTGHLATGSRDSTIRLWTPIESGWAVEPPIKSHTASVEDVQWKPTGGNILASCSVDQSIQVFDIKQSKSKPQIMIRKAHEADVNVISWSPFQEEFILSGGDDGASCVWDLRNISEPIALIKWHKKPITSVGWHPTDTATFAVSSLDNSITIWDMSVEAAGTSGSPDIDCPDQLMFQHMGQTHISMAQWHPQIPGVIISTAEDGFNVFKTFNM